MKDGGLTTLMPQITRYLPRFEFNMVFDVGANVGDFATEVATSFPAAKIHAFEPAPSTLATLKRNTQGLRGIQCHGVVLSNIAGQVRFRDLPNSTGNSIITNDGEGPLVRRIPGDEFCRTAEINRLSYLKIDTEGHDLDVLAGFSTMLDRQAIDLAETEVSMSVLNKRHADFSEVKSFMESKGYLVFSVFEQTMETYFSGRPHLRRCNVVFVSSEMVERNAIAPGMMD